MKTTEKPRGRDIVSRTEKRDTTPVEFSKSARHTAPASEIANGRSKPDARMAASLSEGGGTAISCCVQDELSRYFDMLDGEKPSGLYRMVIRQAEHALLHTVMRECGGNQSRAAEWLGISRGNLRNKLANMD